MTMTMEDRRVVDKAMATTSEEVGVSTAVSTDWATAATHGHLPARPTTARSYSVRELRTRRSDRLRNDDVPGSRRHRRETVSRPRLVGCPVFALAYTRRQRRVMGPMMAASVRCIGVTTHATVGSPASTSAADFVGSIDLVAALSPRSPDDVEAGKWSHRPRPRRCRCRPQSLLSRQMSVSTTREPIATSGRPRLLQQMSALLRWKMRASHLHCYLWY